MRIIGGKHSGYRFAPPRNIPARPTTDIAKEGLFNVLNNIFDFEGMIALDLFGGTGSISYELASRGCTDITLVELDKRSAEFIQKTTTELQLPISVIKGDVFKYMGSTQKRFNFIFAGPPYPLPNLHTIPDYLFQHQLLLPDGWFILEHNPHHNFDQHPKFLQKRNYGTTIFSIFEEPPLEE